MRLDVNVIVDNENLKPNADLIPLLFLDERFNTVGTSTTMWDLLAVFQFFPSKSQARKNWRQTGREVPAGFTTFTIGKLKHTLTIWNPIACDELVNQSGEK